MLLTALTLLAHLTLLISATPGYVPEKRASGYTYYPRSKTVSPRSISVNPHYSQPIPARRSHTSSGGGGAGGGEGGSYSGPAQILQTATTLINVHPTAGYRPYTRNHAASSGAGGSEYSHSESVEYNNQRSSPHSNPSAKTWTSRATSTTTELNMYQGGKKVVEFKADIPGAHVNYPYSHPSYQQSHETSNSYAYGASHEYHPSPSPPPAPAPAREQPQFDEYGNVGHSENRQSVQHNVQSTSTTTELNIDQGGNKVNFKWTGHPMNYPYHPQAYPSYDPWYKYNTPPPQPPQPTTQPPNYRHETIINVESTPAPPAPPPVPTREPYLEHVTRQSKSKPETFIRVGNVNDQHENDKDEYGPDGKKKYKVLICKLQQQ